MRKESQWALTGKSTEMCPQAVCDGDLLNVGV